MTSVVLEAVLATTNAHKLEEFHRMLRGTARLQLEALPEPFEVEEDAETFAGNARKKAVTVARLSGRPTLADDSGLEVVALGGRPGIHSARYAETAEGRIARVLGEMAGKADRRAAFVCALCLAWPDGRLIETEGRVEGVLTQMPAGGGGFGYDPIFQVQELGRTLAEASAAEKDTLSHRGRALTALLDKLEGFR